jgi:hypothetical protein
VYDTAVVQWEIWIQNKPPVKILTEVNIPPTLIKTVNKAIPSQKGGNENEVFQRRIDLLLEKMIHSNAKVKDLLAENTKAIEDWNAGLARFAFQLS